MYKIHTTPNKFLQEYKPNRMINDTAILGRKA